MSTLVILLNCLEFACSYNFAVLILVTYKLDAAVISARCCCSMKKSEPPHNLEARINLVDCLTSGRCSCVAGVQGYCHHVVGLLYYMAHCKRLGLRSIPDTLTSTSMPQRWSIPTEIQDILVKKPIVGANYNKFIKSTLYSPSNGNCLMPKKILITLKPNH